ncbi:MAG: hypothetical protein WCF88_20785 [Candidatus Acidiferrales bacterium]|jgi:hypothetical protein
MRPILNLWMPAVLIALSTSAASGQAARRRDELENFNNHYPEWHLKMVAVGIWVQVIWFEPTANLEALCTQNFQTGVLNAIVAD